MELYWSPLVLFVVFFAASCACEPSQWFSCPLYTNTPHDLSSNFTSKSELIPDDSLRVECAFVSMPLNYNDTNDTRMIRVFVKRLTNKNVPLGRSNQLWFFPGEVGDDSSGIEPWMYQIYGQIGDKFELYTSDHRGAGRSSKLSCDTTQAEVIGSDGGISITLDEYVKCVKVNQEYYSKFTITAAAMDLKNLMEMFTTPTQKVFIYGMLLL